MRTPETGEHHIPRGAHGLRGQGGEFRQRGSCNVIQTHAQTRGDKWSRLPACCLLARSSCRLPARSSCKRAPYWPMAPVKAPELCTPALLHCACVCARARVWGSDTRVPSCTHAHTRARAHTHTHLLVKQRRDAYERVCHTWFRV